MKVYRKESRQIYMSVEGKNCEVIYFEHLARLINNSGRNKYNLKIKPVPALPMDYAKRNAYKPTERRKKGGAFPYFHIQDMEDYYDEELRKKFYTIIDGIKEAKKTFNIDYKLGYSNYTFDLWILLHAEGYLNYNVTDRKAYLNLINKSFKREFISMSEFKKEEEFRRILEDFVTIDSIFQAIDKAERMELNNIECGNKQEIYQGFSFYRDNPATSVHEVVKIIFEICGMAKSSGTSPYSPVAGSKVKKPLSRLL